LGAQITLTTSDGGREKTFSLSGTPSSILDIHQEEAAVPAFTATNILATQISFIRIPFK
jgi:hypothetical protein